MTRHGIVLFLLPMGLTDFLAQPLLAQTAGSSVSWFRMFLWSDSPVGLAIIWLLLLMSALSIGYIIKLFMNYRRDAINPQQTQQQLEQMFREKRYRDAIEFSKADTSYLATLTSSALNEASNGFVAMERAVEETADAQTTRMLRPVEYLNVVGNISPMLGLFGTVYGMIVAFQKLVEAGGKPNPADLAAGISTALVTTFWGLVVAMPALAAYALIRNKIDALSSDGVLIVEALIRPFKPSGRGKGSSRTPADQGITQSTRE